VKLESLELRETSQAEKNSHTILTHHVYEKAELTDVKEKRINVEMVEKYSW
jgi:NAD(P)H-hydrate repair Nnr-like enzyme with NAD(P)H-hydrate dehydratase domain